MGRPIRFSFRVPIYRTEFTVVVSRTPHETAKKYYREFPALAEMGGWDAITASNELGSVVMLFSDCLLTHNLIAHEVHHAVGFLMSWARNSSDNDESAAMLCGYLTEQIYRQLKTRNKKPK